MGMVTLLWLDNEGIGAPFRLKQEVSLFSQACRPDVGTTQPPIQCEPAELSVGVKRPKPEVAHSSSSSAVVKSEWSYISTY